VAATRSRVEITQASRPVLPPHVHLRFDRLRDKWVVLAPEKVLWPDEIGADILNRCTGRDTVSQIIGGLAEDYDASAEEIAPDVLAFLQEWSDRLLIRCGEDR